MDKCPFCNLENKCAKCQKPIKQSGRVNHKTKEALCIDCYKIILKEEKPEIEKKPVEMVRKTGGGGNKTEDADKFFDKTMEKLNQLGEGDKRKQDVNEGGRNEEIKHLQKQAQKVITIKQKENDKQGKTFKGV